MEVQHTNSLGRIRVEQVVVDECFGDRYADVPGKGHFDTASLQLVAAFLAKIAVADDFGAVRD